MKRGKVVKTVKNRQHFSLSKSLVFESDALDSSFMSESLLLLILLRNESDLLTVALFLKSNESESLTVAQ